MLNILKRIVQEVNAAFKINDALKIMVTRVREAFSIEACSIYIIDRRKNEFVLMASDGLEIRSNRQVCMAIDQGLVGLVGQKKEPINIEDSASHPQFFYSS